MENIKRPQRKALPHFPGVEWHSTAIIHFVTVCTKDRQPFLASADVHDALVEAWAKADYFSIGRYVIMPDHIHLFCAPIFEAPGYMEPWIKYWKSLTTKRLPWAKAGSFWQRDFWDTQIRRTGGYQSKWEYVRFNPVRHGLVQDPDSWPYRGEIRPMEWHD